MPFLPANSMIPPRSTLYAIIFIHMIINGESFTASNTRTFTKRQTLYKLPLHAVPEGTFRPFASYAWDKLIASGLVEENSTLVPDHLATNSVKGNTEGSTINIEVKSTSSTDKESSLPSLRMARYALLESLIPSSNGMISSLNGIHVLNLVLFPDTQLPLPVLGMDLVSLPGNNHLIAIDFQPIISFDNSKGNDDGDNDNGSDIDSPLFPPQFAKYEQRIKRLHEKHVLEQIEILPWGGDIPKEAERFFSRYALWTRLKGEGALLTIQSKVYDAFCDYLDLYLEIMSEARDLDENVNVSEKSNFDLDEIQQGHTDYLNYRRDNDPARPMLTRLYGENYTEELISEVLFKLV